MHGNILDTHCLKGGEIPDTHQLNNNNPLINNRLADNALRKSMPVPTVAPVSGHREIRLSSEEGVSVQDSGVQDSGRRRSYESVGVQDSGKSLGVQDLKIALLGGSGFIGSHVAEALDEEAFHFSAFYHNNPLPQSGLKQEKLDFRQQGDLVNALSGHQVLINCIADVRLHKSLQTYRETQVELTRKLCRAAAEAGVKRFVQLSTVEVYGKGKERAFSELDKCDPMFPFQQSCLEREETVIAEAQALGLEYTILRPAATFGRRSSYVKFLLDAHAEGYFPVIGGGGTRFDAVDTRDIARAMLMLATEPRAKNQTYLLKGYNTSMLAVKKCVDELRGQSSSLRNLPLPLANSIGTLMEVLLPYSKTPPLTRFVVHAATNAKHYDDSKIRSLGFRTLYQLEHTLRYVLKLG